MIHRDLCDPKLTKNHSSLRLAFHFLISRYVCWDGSIPLTPREMAEFLECDDQSIRKFIKKGVQEGILSLEGEKLSLLKRVDDFQQGYIKHYPFLETLKFRSLNIHTQRFILYTLWYGVHTGRTLKRELSSLYHSTNEYQGVLNLYYKAPLYPILEEAKTFLKLDLIEERGKEWVRVIGLREEYSQQEALQNQGELKGLEEKLIAHYADEHVSNESREEILKIKKHYLQNLGSIGLDLFSHALNKLLSLHKLFELDLRKEVGAYLRSILIDFEEKILPTIQKRIQYVEHALEHVEDLLITPAAYWINRFQTKLSELRRNLFYIKQKRSSQSSTENREIGSFPFYNWLEQ